jgi:signal transduction histidine kinase
MLPLAALNGARIWQQFKEDRAIVLAERERLVRSAALSLQVFIENNVASVQALALHPELSEGRASAQLQAFLERAVQANPSWVAMGVFGADGHHIAGTVGGVRINLGDRPYFRQAVSTGRAAVSSGIIGRVTGRLNIVIAVPLDMRTGGRGVLIAPLPIGAFAERLLANQLPGLRLAVIDPDAQLIAHTHLKPALQVMRDAPGAEPALRGEAGSRQAVVEGVESLVSYAPVQEYGWAVIAAEAADQALAVPRQALRERIATFGLMLAIVAMLAWILGGRLAAAYQKEVAMRAELESALRTRDEFLASASHDLRNPLAAVRSATDLMQASMRRDGAIATERLAKCIAHVDSAARRMAALIDAFLDIARLRTGAALDLALQEVDLAGLVREIAAEAQLMSPRHAVLADLPERLPVIADSARIHRAIANLVNNAVKYSPHGGDVRLQLAHDAAGSEAILVVADSGVGIPPDELELVFKRFRRGSNVIGRIPGTGVGLAGTRQVVEQHGGRMEIDSVIGQGTRVTVRLPTESRAASAQAAQREAA